MSGKNITVTLVLATLLFSATTGGCAATDFSGPAKTLEAEVRVCATERIGTVNPDIYGLFTEMCFYEFNSGSWAEMLKGRKFAGDDGWDEKYGVVESWFPIGRNDKTHFMHDNTIYYCTSQSQKIVSEAAANTRTGIGQDKLYFEKTKGYQVRVNLRQEGITGPVTVAMEGAGGVCAGKEISIPDAKWSRFTFKLKPTQTDRDGRFTITFSGSGTLWLGTVSLMADDNMSGFRKDVVEALKALNVPNMRWPGGNMVSEYRWQEGIGDRDKRPARFIRELWDPFDVGIDEFLELCRLIDTKPYIALNSGDGTAAEAANWVEYCNGGIDTKYGKLRAENGHPQPYNVKLWGIGNEMFGNWQNGHVDEETYARRHVAIAKAILAVDKDIKLVATGGRYWKYPRWNQALFNIAGDYFDYLSLHSYAKKYRSYMKKTDLEDPKFAEEFYYYIVSSPYGVEEQIYETDKEIRAALPNRPDIKIAFDEWNCWAYLEPYEHVDFALRDALYTAGFFHAFRRQHKAVTLANFSKTVNAMPLIKVNQYGMFLNPQYLAFKMYLDHCGPRLLATDVRCAGYPAPDYERGRPQAIGRIKYLDVSATAGDDGKTVYVGIINLHIDKAVKTKISFDKWDFSPTVKIYEIYDDDYMAENTFEKPNRLTIKEDVIKVAGSPFIYNFKPHSVTVMEFGKK